MAALVIRQDLFQIAKQIEKNIQENEVSEAEMHAKELHVQALHFVRDPQNASEIPFPLTKKIIEILTLEDIQFCDGVKRELSRTAALISEHVYAVCKKEKRPIYPQTRERFVSGLSLLLLTLPKKEVTTSFAVNCCRAAIHALTSGEGKWIELSKNQGKGLVIGALSGGAGMSAGPLAAPLVEIGCDIYKEKTDRSYRSLLDMKKLFLPIDTLEKLKMDSIQTELGKYNQKPKYAICLSEVFARIMLNPQADPKLKDIIFSSVKKEHLDEGYFRSLFQPGDQGSNLCSIARLNDGKKGYWKGRLRSVEVLINLSKEVPYQNQSIAILAFRLAVERERIPANHLWHTYKQESSQQQKTWKQYLAFIKPDDIKKKDEALKNALRTEVQGVNQELQENANRQQNLQAELSKSMGQAGGSLSVGGVNRTPQVIRKEIDELEKSKQVLKQQQTDQESWVNAQETVIESIQKERFTLLEEVTRG